MRTPCIPISIFASCLALLLVSDRLLAQDLQSKESVTLRCTVVNNVTNEPIPRALVVSPDNRFATITGDDGRFEFKFSPESSNPAPTEGVVLTSRPDTLIARRPGYLEDGNGTVSLAAAKPGTDVVIGLTPEAKIIGRVTLADSGPAARAGVELYRRQVEDGHARWVSAGGAATRSNGEFRFAELPAGTYKLFTQEHLDERDPLAFISSAQQFGYPPIYYPTATDFASAAPILLAAGQTFQAELTPVRQGYFSVKIPVANAPQNIGMNIVVSPQGRKGPGYSLGYTNATGVIEGMLPNGTYTVAVTTYGPQQAYGSTNITRAARSPATALTFPLAPPSMSL